MLFQYCVTNNKTYLRTNLCTATIIRYCDINITNIQVLHPHVC